MPTLFLKLTKIWQRPSKKRLRIPINDLLELLIYISAANNTGPGLNILVLFPSLIGLFSERTVWNYQLKTTGMPMMQLIVFYMAIVAWQSHDWSSVQCATLHIYMLKRKLQVESRHSHPGPRSHWRCSVVDRHGGRLGGNVIIGPSLSSAFTSVGCGCTCDLTGCSRCIIAGAEAWCKVDRSIVVHCSRPFCSRSHTGLLARNNLVLTCVILLAGVHQRNLLHENPLIWSARSPCVLWFKYLRHSCTDGKAVAGTPLYLADLTFLLLSK